MPPKSQSLYQVLRISRDAKPQDIDRAYRRIVAEMQKETTPPDPRLRVMIEHAHDVLMDPVRRENYDTEYFAPKARLDRARRSRAVMTAVGAAVAVAAVATWIALRPEAEQRTPAPIAQVQSAAAMAVGRVARIEVNGGSTPLGAAFAIAEGTLVTSCEGLAPDAEVVVRFGARAAPVRVTSSDPTTKLCKLSGGSVGSWPLELARAGPRQGELVYVARLRGNEPHIAEGRLRDIVPAGELRLFEAEPAGDPGVLGTPLLDMEGRVLGAATRVGDRIRYAPVPRTFLPEAPPVEHSGPQRRPAQPATVAEPKTGPDISPERRERLEKAFRPPPQVPDDI